MDGLASLEPLQESDLESMQEPLVENGALDRQRGKSRRRSSQRKETSVYRRFLKLRKDERLAPPVDITFQAMQMRKVMRKINGTYESDKPWTMLWVFLTLLLFFGVAGANFRNGHFELHFSTGQLGFLSLVIVVTFLVLVYTLTRVIVVFRWMLYWLLSAQVLTLLLYKQYNMFGPKTPLWIPVLLITLEVLTAFIYLFVNFLYPKILGSTWFLKNIGPKNYWEVRIIGPWTLTYSSGFGNRHTCSYRGETNSEGLPHGYGHWMDDSYHGEILTGWWENGKPVGPFRSREFGSGYAFDNVMIGFVLATDDNFTSYKLIPSNDEPFRCGVAGVECSVSGGFFSHLPKPKILHGPYRLAPGSRLTPQIGAGQNLLEDDSETNTDDVFPKKKEFLADATVAACLSKLRFLSVAHPLSSILISAKEGRGVAVAGHIFNQNKKCSTRRCKQLVIDVIYPDQCNSKLNAESTSLGNAVNRDISEGLQSTENQIHDIEEGSESTGSSSSPDDSLIHSATPDFRSSLQFSEYDETRVSQELDVEKDEEEDYEEEDDLRMAEWDDSRWYGENADSDVESVDYDSGTFRVDPFSLTEKSMQSSAAAVGATVRIKHNISSASLTSDEQKKIILDSSQAKGPLQNGFDEATGHFQQVENNSSIPYLRVRGWRSTMEGHAEALIFIPGFNCSVKHSLERFGQFLAMGHFPSYIKPFLFSWPAGKVATYLKAGKIAAGYRTAQAFGMLLDGLYAAGIKDVHIMTHSMGVQALMGCFQDTEEGERSQVSLRFSLAPDFQAETHTSDSIGNQDDILEGQNSSEGRGVLRCRTITLLNPDFPLSAFVDHSFVTLRRVCDHITVVGNRKDKALFWSEIANGIVQTVDYYAGSQSYAPYITVPMEDGPQYSGPRDADSCCPSYCTYCCHISYDENNDSQHGQDRLFSRQLSMGRCIFSLYARSVSSEGETRREPASLLFRARQTLMDRMRGGKRKRRRLPNLWLDLDAIDTTWMESNVHALRHNYFNLNPVLIEDLSELIVTGRRASERSTLLHREGNIYSYCQAPACVVNES